MARSYTRSGWLVTDSLALRTYTGIPNFVTHAWGLRMTYDSLGRRRSLKHPAALYNVDNVATSDSAIYIYNAGTGALSEVRDLKGEQFTYTDDAAGRHVRMDGRPTVGGSIGVSEVDTLDADGRMRRRLIYLGGVLKSNAAISNDARGKQRTVSYTGLYASQAQTDSMYYAGHGPLAAIVRTYSSPISEQRLEEFRTEGLANGYYSRRWGDIGAVAPQEFITTYADLTGRFKDKTLVPPVPLQTNGIYQDQTHIQTYDLSGNVEYVWRRAYLGNTDVASWENTHNYYGADEKLRYVQRTAIGTYGAAQGTNYLQGAASGAWEEYWYDALGRRVLKRELRTALSTEANKRDVLDRFVWDGDQLLYEVRIPGGLTDNVDATGFVGSRFHGTVGYIHGRGLDAPLALNDSLGHIPITDWRGLYEGTVRATGAGADCATNSNASGCWNITWPSKMQGVAFEHWGPTPDVPEEWRGSIILGQQDKAGLSYMRNRYYDPGTGRFTQVDPIGIAGGLNVYGFASGDPVNFSDPFGLFDCKQHRETCADALQGPGFFDPIAILSGGIAGSLEAFGARILGRLAGREGASVVVDEFAASTPVGRLGKPMSVQEGSNSPALIGARKYTGHALDRMQEHGITPSVVEDAIENGAASAGREGATVHTTSEVRVVTNPNGSVKTVMPHHPD